MWPAAQAAMDRRWKILLRALGLVSNTHNMLCSMRRTLFVDNFIYALNYLRFRKVGKQHAHFRWFDSGDLLSEDHLAIICDIARATPEVQHWLPTKEYRIVGNTHIKIPSNLTIRVSAAMIGGSAPNLGYPVSVVNGIGLACPAPSQDGKCMDCRACWDSEIPVINYTLH